MKKQLNYQPNNVAKESIRSSSGGFTLIEVAIVTIISGIMFIPMFQMYQTYRQQQQIQTTLENIEISQSLISSLLDRYPCPADPELPPTDPNYGKEQCTAGGGVKVVAGARTPAETVLIGAVPIRDIKDNASGLLTDDVGLDAWGNKLLYAVTTSQTSGSTYSSDAGQIDAVNEFNSPTTPPIRHSPTAGFNKNASFVVLSHGPDGKGAYSNSGALISACGTTRKDDENCNDDSTFMAALGFYEGDSPNYFDDLAYFSAKTDNSLWDNVDVTSGDIYSKNKKNVGIKQANPTQKLDVNGSIISTGNTKAKEICDYTNNSKCFDIEKISGSTGMVCGGNNIMSGISNNNVTCTGLTAAAPIDTDCKAAGKWVTGLKSDGTVICSP